MFSKSITRALSQSTKLSSLGYALPTPGAYAAVKDDFVSEIQALRDNGTIKNERIILGKQGSHIKVQNADGSVTEELNFCANNYLGLSSHPDLIEAQKRVCDTHGAGVSSVRFICGTQDIHKTLEKQIADFHGREDAIIYPSCFDANAGIFEVLLGPEDAVISDSLNHASIIDGVRLCKAKRARYQHLDMAELEEQLQKTQDCRRRLVVTDGVFSMDGDVAPLDVIGALCEKYNALLMIDECHATGFMGPNGRGIEELQNCEGVSTVINSTMGKALGGAAGGYTTGPKEIIDLLRNKSRPYSFSNSLPPAVVAACTEAFNIVSREGESLSTDLAAKTKRFRSGMEAAGFTISGHDHPICPVMTYDAHKNQALGRLMADEGIFVIPFSFPVVASGKERIRVQISTTHTNEDIDRTVAAFIKGGLELGIIGDKAVE